MTQEEQFLAAIQQSPQDDTHRLVYADWLEERGDPRADYLRIQCELRKTWTYKNPCPALVDEMRKVRSGIDLQWLAQVRTCTTPPPPLPVEKLLPFLKGRGKPAFLLHPRPGDAAGDASKIGGLFHWPADEPWPTCPEHADCPYVPALQLRKRDVPRVLKFKGRSNLLQVLWCPHDHEESYCVRPKVFWRRAETVKQPVKEHPEPDGDDDYIPRGCVLKPERVKEFPDPSEFDGDEYRGIASNQQFLAAASQLPIKAEGHWDISDNEGVYQTYLSTSQGTKVGGYPNWVQSPEQPNCRGCGTLMEHLCSFGSWEYDGVTWGRWLPIEERDTLTSDFDDRRRIQSAADWMFGDAGNFYLFVCRQCEDWPVSGLMQCS